MASDEDEGVKSVCVQVPFHDLCSLFEKIYSVKKTERKKQILKSFLDSWRQTHNKIHGDNTTTDDSFFPALRLILPQFDKERSAYGIKEAVLAKHYIDILGIGKDSLDAKKLLNYRAPSHAKKEAGDFAMVAYFVLKNRCPEKGSLNLKQVNDFLDKLANSYVEHKKENTKHVLQMLLHSTTALEQKWLIRIILKELKIGISERTVFEVYHPDAMDLYNVSSTLSKVCCELRDPNTRKSGSVITLFSAFKPMLGQRAPIEEVERLMNNQGFYIETKVDGERFMLHKRENTYRYFSRGSNEYSCTFGATSKDGYLTPYIESCFLSDIKSCILDGEMLACNKSNEPTFVSKATNIDFKSVKTYSDNSELHPCFVVFDILLVNNQSLTNLPLKERKNYFEKVFTTIPGRIQIVACENGENKQDVINALNNAVDKYEEGIVIKSPSSIYQPNIRTGSGWLKIKPDYVDGLCDELDVLIIGGYFGTGARGGMLSHFLCGVSNDQQQFYSFCKVSSGFSLTELKDLCRQLHPYWKKFDPEKLPASVIFTKEKPDVWIEPSKSKIVQIKAAEIVNSNSYKAGLTLRFPRVEKVRSDKTWSECLNMNELWKLRNTAQGKLAYQHKTEYAEPAPKKRRAVPRLERPVTVARHFETADVSSITEKSNILQNKEFYIVNGTSDLGKITLEKKVLENGGTIVQNPGKDTYCVIAFKSNLRVKNVMKKEIFDVVNVSWLIQCLEDQQLLPWLPSHMMYTSAKTAERFAMDYDNNGDSYMKDTDITELRTIFQTIEEKQNMVKLTSSDIAQVECRYFTNNIHGLFRQFRFYLDQFSEIGDANTKIENCCLDTTALELRFHGGQICETFDENVSHVVLSSRDGSRLELIQRLLRDRSRKAHVVTEQWVTACVENGQILNERNYGA